MKLIECVSTAEWAIVMLCKFECDDATNVVEEQLELLLCMVHQ